MARIPVGLRFDPSDEELIAWYLYPKIMNSPLEWQWIAEKEIYNAEPWIVFGDVDESLPYWNTKNDKKTIFVFTEVTKTSSNSKRNSRRAGSGTWSGQTGPKNIVDSKTGAVIGCERMLSFQHSKKGSKSDDTNHWTMHEYSLIGDGLKAIGDRLNNIVLCKITKFPDRRRIQQHFAVVETPASSARGPNPNKRGAEEEEEESAFKKQRRILESFKECENTLKGVEFTPENMQTVPNPNARGAEEEEERVFEKQQLMLESFTEWENTQKMPEFDEKVAEFTPENIYTVAELENMEEWTHADVTRLLDELDEEVDE